MSSNFASDGPTTLRDLSGAKQRSPAEQDAAREIDTDRPSKVYYEDFVKIPGFGDQPDRCHQLKPVGFCADHGHAVLGSSSCRTRPCPAHWRDWTQEAVVNMTARLAAYRHVVDGAEKRLLHAVVSPPQDRHWTAERFYKTRSEAYDVLEAVGGRGGSLIPHPYRTSDAGDELFKTAVEHGDWEENRGKWSLLHDAADDWDDLAQYIEPGPHYHGLVPCPDFDPDAVPAGWVAKNVRSLPRFHYQDVESYRPMARVAWYLLSHSAVGAYYDTRREREVEANTVTWWGALHPAVFNPEQELSSAGWHRIQLYALQAVTTRPGEGGIAYEGSTTDEHTCPHDGCESVVVPIRELRDYLRDDDWVASIPFDQLMQLRGICVWADDYDRPPPPTMNRALLLEWLADLGRDYTGPTGQTGLNNYGFDVLG